MLKICSFQLAVCNYTYKIKTKFYQRNNFWSEPTCNLECSLEKIIKEMVDKRTIELIAMYTKNLSKAKSTNEANK